MSSLVSLSAACTPSTFSSLQVFGTQILSIETLLVTNFSASVPAAYRFFQPTIQVQNASFCNVTVTYTHPGQDDEVFAQAWLPIGNWNGRLQAVGGAGWAAGSTPQSFEAMKGAIGDGYATITDDGGLTGDIEGGKDWALLSPGSPNLYKLNNLGSISVNEQSIIGKSLIRSFYGRGPSFSYWSGCSQGGRQGIMAAQRYPTAFDGIAAASPALYIPEVLAAVQWPQQFMNSIGTYPYPCELDALTAAAIQACDGLDGLLHGIISDPAACLRTFDPFSLVGTPIPCSTTNTTIPITHAAAAVANATWQGPYSPSSGRQIWHGLPPGADLTGNDPSSGGQAGIASTNCTTTTPLSTSHNNNNITCKGTTNFLSGPYFTLLLAAGSPSFDLSALSDAEFASLARAGIQQYSSFLSSSDPDLRAFRDAGGKMVTIHGLADQAVSPAGTRGYYASVEEEMGGSDSNKNVWEFYRHFEIPGMGHCFGGRSAGPYGLWEELRAWVEGDDGAEEGPTRPVVEVLGLDGKVQKRVICPWPERGVFDREGCGDVKEERCWRCV